MTPRATGTPPGIPGFRPVRALGSGGFADVFLYEQHRPRRTVAVKVLLGDGLDAAARRSFETEADLMAQLSTHPSIVTIYESGVADDGRPYLAMELCSRPNLGERFRRERLSVPDVLQKSLQVAGAVETAHRAGILHRDIKPANILVTDYDRPALTDFGIAGTAADAAGAAGLSVPWAPPEAFEEPQRGGRQSDVWSLGATVHALLAGRSPFEVPGGDNTAPALVQRIRTGRLPGTGRPDVPDALEQVLATAMAKDPAARYRTVHELALALQQVQQSLTLSVTPIDLLAPVAPGRSRRDEDGHDGTRVRGVVSVSPTALPVRPPAPATPGVLPRPPQGWPAVPAADPSAGAAAPVDDLTGTVGPAGAPSLAPRPAAPRRRARLVVPAVAAVVLLAAGGAAVLLVGRAGDAPAPGGAATATFAPQAPVNAAGRVVPVPTDLTGTVVGDRAEFTWTNPDPQPGDYFVYTVDTPGAEAEAEQTDESRVSLATNGSRTCVEVALVRRDGRSADPVQGCTP